ncbi:MAG TPA: class I SAM-dependent methyltransferase [Victivallales bacterium]|nr:class I SAM-dependent methyltransferase [Victivallales bacterium]
MTEKYNQIIAGHYSAFRPALHEIILEHVLTKNESFQKGLDVGCGTGYSAKALTKYCSHVYGIDPSKSMLEEATKNAKITYLQGSGKDLPVSDGSVDIVTFAGSLFYANSPSLVKELRRVCHKQTIIIPYDFEILFNDFLHKFDIDIIKSVSNYNHKINFSDNDNFTEIIACNEKTIIKVTANELAHVLLSSSYLYDLFVEKFSVSDPFNMLVNKLENKQHYLEVNLYYSKYIINK